MIGNIEKEKLVFRKLNNSDRELFVKLRFEYFLIDGFDINENNRNEIKNNLIKYFDDNIKSNNFIGIICEYENKIVSVAYLALSINPPNPYFIDGKIGTLLNVFTYPEYRNKGIATKLLKEIIEEAKKENINVIKLSATKNGEKLYKKLGFNESKYKEMNLKL